ncbi:hypothetical protein SEEM030_14352 [Salmonella enterica subsp. enterica serovar Montevideo str. SARB30]|nr:hypothetical protein SEEM315_21738 [Salmonella enterica subsp. enterica serovar Montevideo str. 315996572]EFY16382.1 hypothetical protein SEEM971_02775 [Salmonella enterica subsp. enterica serovar Montevideo str. 495297-1]EFY21840.1 hypothetical protein SEEM973_02527 [Salmonella enterica subsp. enterica serovar Montevideo str. 495297-3]EFY26322.1 hypothetical protein SEEM974_03980 [Salmonella enterica subsp. enterica serovar Montevideo str. 495297-4]EFY40949.1 hypothetical protein SEEM054_12
MKIARHLSKQQQLLLSLWLFQIAQGYRFLKQSHHMQHQIL